MPTPLTAHTEPPVIERITEIFDRCFAVALNTRLCGGFEEPYYRPAGKACSHHRIEFTRDYPASALHEAAHWCVAGERRRQLQDYGYWYSPDGRSAEQQREFERVEAKPQALEWIFSNACGLRFRASADNLRSGLGPSDAFKEAIWRQARKYCREEANSRARQFALALAQEFGRPGPLRAEHYHLSELA